MIRSGRRIRRAARSCSRSCSVQALEKRVLFAAGLDPSFSGDGRVLTDFPSTLNDPDAIVPLPGGKFLVGARVGGGYGVARYNADGSPDTTFGGGDGVVTGYGASGLTVAPDGKLLVAGTGFGVTRYNADGTLDTAFGAGGPDGDGVAAVLAGDPFKGGHAVPRALPDGKVLLLGGWINYGARGNSTSRVALARFNADGTLDPTFGPGGFEGDGALFLEGFEDGNGPNPPGLMAWLPSGKAMLLNGNAVMRYNADGTRDTTFGPAGDGLSAVPPGLQGVNVTHFAVADDGSALLAGGKWSGTSDDLVVGRVTASGALDSAFGAGGPDGDGVVTTDFGANEYPYTIAAAPGGKFYVSGTWSRPVAGNPPQSERGLLVARFNADGSPDGAFAPGAGGGHVVLTFSPSPDFGPGPIGRALTPLPSGGVLIGGIAPSDFNAPTDNFRGQALALARLDDAGSLDATFSPGGADGDGKLVTYLPALSRARAALMQPDGRVVVGGAADGVFALARYNPDGSLDATFGAGGIDGDGRVLTIVFGGPGGFQDLSGEPGGLEGIRDLALLPDGRILAVGTQGGLATAVRYNADGSPDPSFAPGYLGMLGDTAGAGFLDVQGRPVAVALAPDGTFVVATNLGEGITEEEQGSRVARFNADGTLRQGFDVPAQIDWGTSGETHSFFNVGRLDDVEVDVHNVAYVAVTGVDRNGLPMVGMLRFSPEGVVDGSYGLMQSASASAFNVDDPLKFHATDLALLPGGRALVSTQHKGGVLRFSALGRPDGPLDTIVSNDGVPVGYYQSVGAVIPLEGDKALVAGESPDGKFVLGRFNLGDGSRDAMFDGEDGIVTTDFGVPAGATAMAAGADGRVVLAGWAAASAAGAPSGFAVAAYDGNGSVPLPPSAPPQPDVTPPTATLPAIAPITGADLSGLTFEVRFEDDRAIDVATLDDADVRVVGPDGSATAVRFAGPGAGEEGNGTPRRVLYRVLPNGGGVSSGGFTAADNGTWTVSVEPNQVFDTSGHPVAGGTLGTFEVNIPTNLPNLVAADVRASRTTFWTDGRRRGRVSFLLRNEGLQRAVGTLSIVVMTRTQPSMETGQHSRVVGTKTVSVNLRPGRARRLSVPLSAFPADRPDGPYYFVVNADSDNGVAETSEVDNVAASARPVQVGPRPARRRRDVDSLFGLTRV